MAYKSPRRAEVRLAAAKRGLSWVPSIESAKREIRRTRRQRYRRHRRNVLIFIIVFSLLAGAGIFYYGFDIVTLQGASMSPAMDSGNMVLCVKQRLLNRLAGLIPEEYRSIERGDPVLLSYKLKSDQEGDAAQTLLIMKRVIGVGGDVLDSGGGELILNQDKIVGSAGDSDLVYPVRVPAGRMFVTGDQSSVSIDSRHRAFGMVAEADVVGRPLAVVWPLFAVGLVN